MDEFYPWMESYHTLEMKSNEFEKKTFLLEPQLQLPSSSSLKI